MDGTKRVLKQVTIDGNLYRTAKAARQHLSPLLHKLNDGSDYHRLHQITFGELITRYEAEEMPPKKSTRDSYGSLIRTHLRPRWNGTPLDQMKPGHIREWLMALPLAALSKGHIRSLMHKLLDLAMLWEYLAVSRNPLELVKLPGITKREKRIVVLTPEDYQAIVESLPSPYNAMVQVVATLGLRLSEVLGLKWTDIDWDARTVMIQRSSYRGSLSETKTAASHALLPLADQLAEVLHELRKIADADYAWVFANPKTGKPYLGPSIQQRWIRPAGESIGIKGLGFHTFRHSYKSLLDRVGAPMGAQKDLMRHSAISVTMNIYGDTMTAEKRLQNDKVAALLFAKPKAPSKNPSMPLSASS